MARRRIVCDEGPRNTSVMLYCSLFLIMLTFFVVLASMSIMDERRQKLAIGSILGSFGVLPSGRSPFFFKDVRNLLPGGEPLDERPVTLKVLEETLSDTGLRRDVTVSRSKMGVTITVGSGVLFDGNGDTPSKDGLRVLDAVARILTRVDNPVIVTGHTDSIPVETPPFRSNWGLSGARALAVLRHLERRGVDARRITAYGMGFTRPLATNATVQGRRLNNRVEILVAGDLPGDLAVQGVREGDDRKAGSILYKGFTIELEEQ
ncbi:MAG TPA: OmpA family protein [Deltaproteobacteria bacterium]|nr:OmpA family protein [Deltaproteobacteria bacterium]